VWADEPASGTAENTAVESISADAPATASDETEFTLSDEVRDILSPLFMAIKEAEASRSTIEVLSDSLMTGQVIDSKQGTYQIASRAPDRFTIYFKEPGQRTRLYNDGQALVVATAADAFFRLPAPLSNQQVIVNAPIPLGPYPEPILALTLAGVDPAVSLVNGMRSIEIVDEHDFQSDTPAVHLHGIQADEVQWDLWLTKETVPRPLRMLVDLTPMLLASPELRLPRGYSHQIRFDFVSWRVTGDVDDGLFTFTPAENATEYDSWEHYQEAIALAAARHPLLGQESPEFTATSLAAEDIDSKSWQGKVVVIDFWTATYPPCAEILATIKQVCDTFADKDVVFIAVNVGQSEQEAKAFLEQHGLNVSVALDVNGQITDSFAVDAIPLTMLVGKNGMIESVHQGYPGKEGLQQRLQDELEVLSIGGQISTATSATATSATAASSSNTDTAQPTDPQ
jgi:peroxiredoxin